MHAVIEFSLGFDSFRNIDLTNQGLYMIRSSIIHKPSGKHACAYNQTSGDPAKLVHKIIPAHLEENFAFSKGFLITFYEEVVYLKEMVYFRTEIPCSSDAVHSLVLDLLFSEDPDTYNFAKISSSEFLISFPSSFHSEYVPVIFDSYHSAILDLYCHYLAVEYKFVSASEPSLAAANHFFFKNRDTKRFVGGSETEKVYVQTTEPLLETYRALQEYFLSTNPQTKLVSRILTLEGIGLGSFLSRVASHDPIELSKKLLEEIGRISAQLLSLWHIFSESTAKIPKSLRSNLQKLYKTSVRSRISGGFLSRFKQSDSLVMTTNDVAVRSFKATAKCRRLQNSARDTYTRSISENIPINPMAQPIIIEDVCFTNYSCISEKEAVAERIENIHMFVFVHGYQGSSNDLRLVKNQISLHNPNGFYLMSCINENNSDASIEVQGQRLALEVTQFIIDHFDTSMPDKISFLGHSLGGLIVRAALPYLNKYAKRMHLFMSFGTPHLGIQQNQSKLVQAGIWVLKNMMDSPCLKQLRLEDEHKFLYTLSRYEGIDWFTHMVLLGSPQDLYVSQHSAKIEVRKNEDKNIQLMAHNILRKRLVLYRLTVDFKLSHRVFDSLIGRAAHVQVLEDDLVLKTILHQHPEFFL